MTNVIYIKKTNKIKAAFYFILLAFCSYGQNKEILTLEKCQELAKQNYPLIKQKALIETTKEYNLENASKGYLPQLGIGAQATYQSDVTSLPIKLPGMQIPEISKDQYKVFAEVTQSLTDPLIIKQQKEYIKSNAEVEAQKLEVEIYKLKERINQLYFGTILIEAQLKQTELVRNDLESTIKKIEAAVTNGIAIPSNVDLIKAELLKVEQRIIELNANKKAFVEMLSMFINMPLDVKLILEEPQHAIITDKISRTELKLFDTHKKTLDVQHQLLFAKNFPRLNLFFQGGYGRPGLNMLDNDFQTYFIGGLRLNWNLSGFYTYNKEKKIIGINQALVDVQKETFLFNTNLTLKQQNNEISKLTELILTDRKIIAIREKVKATANHQLENGTITAIDYLNYINAEDQARQNYAFHNIQLLMAQYNYQTTSGN